MELDKDVISRNDGEETAKKQEIDRWNSAKRVSFEVRRFDVRETWRQTKRLSIDRRGRSTRKAKEPSRQISPRARGRLLDLLRNFDAECFVTLTFPSAFAPSTWKEADKCFDRFRRLLPNVSGIKVKEVSEAGRPHFHLLLNHSFSTEDMVAVWGRALKCKDLRCVQPGVRAQKVYDLRPLATYLAKRSSKTSPEKLGPVGSWYSAFGGASNKPILTIAGDQRLMVWLRRLFRMVEKGRCRKRGFPVRNRSAPRGYQLRDSSTAFLMAKNWLENDSGLL